ncbi:MAG TPA: hypothetical protein VGL97_23850, partial [Bryobacteraceae bacterium]
MFALRSIPIIMLRSIAFVLLLGWTVVILPGCRVGSAQLSPQGPAILVTKEPVNFAMRTFDPAAPPPEMPPL